MEWKVYDSVIDKCGNKYRNPHLPNNQIIHVITKYGNRNYIIRYETTMQIALSAFQANHLPLKQKYIEKKTIQSKNIVL